MEQKTKKVKERTGKVIHSTVSRLAIEKAKEIRARYGPIIDFPVVQRILEDRRCIRYPAVEVRFVSDGIESGLFGQASVLY